MFEPKSMLQLYTDVLYSDVVNYCVKDLDIAAGLSNMTGVYSQGFGPLKVVDYNRVSNRCAYLHKYAPVYTAVVCNTMSRILNNDIAFRFRLESGVFSMCSLGGGPGTDVVGVLAGLDAYAGPLQKWRTSVSVVDYMEGWKPTFKSVVNELGRTSFTSRFAEDQFSWKYIQGDLVDGRKYEVWDSVTYSSLVTVIKCLSTFRLKDAQTVIEKIYRVMSFGSFILIVDDVADELTEVIMSTASNHQMIPIFGPLRNARYSFEDLKVTRFGHTSCHQVAVTSLLLMKPLFNPFSKPVFQPSVFKYCKKCGRVLFACSRCSFANNVRTSLHSFLKYSYTNSNSGAAGNKCTGMIETVNSDINNSQTIDKIALSDSVIIEVPE